MSRERGLVHVVRPTHYSSAFNGDVHSWLAHFGRPANRAYIAASALMKAEDELCFRCLAYQRTFRLVSRVVKRHTKRHKENKVDLDFQGSVEVRWAPAAVWIESEANALLAAIYSLTDRSQKLVFAIKDVSSQKFFGWAKEGKARPDRLGSKFGPLFDRHVSAQGPKIYIQRALRARSTFAHDDHPYARFEVDSDFLITDVRYLGLSLDRPGDYVEHIKNSELVLAASELSAYMAWFKEMVLT